MNNLYEKSHNIQIETFVYDLRQSSFSEFVNYNHGEKYFRAVIEFANGFRIWDTFKNEKDAVEYCESFVKSLKNKGLENSKKTFDTIQ